MANDDPFGILLAPPDDPNPYPHIRGDDRYFKTYDPFGTPVLNTSLPAAVQPNWWERRKADYDQYLERGGVLGAAWGMLPPEVRKSWATIPTLWAETTPGAGIRDSLEAAGNLSRAAMAGDPMGMLGAGAGVTLGAIGTLPILGGLSRGIVRATDDAIGAGARALRRGKVRPGEGLPMGEADRAQRMAEQGYTRGYWRGGAKPADGNYYTPDPAAAADFARRHGSSGDTREYALRLGNVFDFHNDVFDVTALRPIASALAKENPSAARELIEHVADWNGRIPAKAVHQIVRSHASDVNAVLRKAGYDTIDAGQELITLRRSKGQVRDADKAAFDPRFRNRPDPFAAVLPPALGLGLFFNEPEPR
ncbi:hypothetical protein [Reyranella sp. CPCC 100927]|uniref:hypothetical protein n=1 Tax=Reyranella sp. CPCC 100927 TaxID=2599616 RepID=UPI0011B597A4|nr:hypothetical protein [Reyranella sp. CPCC 100927]TWT11726.1 hypothetical protein FQU96_14735 [Reyranella sp. CPCC 100927]